MTREEACSKINEAIKSFGYENRIASREPFGSGHINDTFLLKIKSGDGKEEKVILQRMNHEIFKHPEELMENIMNVTSYLREQIIKNGGNPERETLNVVKAEDGKPYFKDSMGCYWRVYKFIEDAVSFDKVEKPDDFYQSAVSFGHFQRLLTDFPAETLHETIPDFHNTAVRFDTFKKAVEEDACGRVKNVKKEIDFVMERQDLTHILMDLLKEKKIPLRVTHNDTKLNNIMIDKLTGKGICVIDLDTVMPGLAVNDFGDSIRFGASTGDEDEIDLSKVECSMDLFELYTKGFVEGCGGSLTEMELSMLPEGAKVMTFECGIRFLTDYIQGDNYFKIHRENHNLDRCRTQFKLVADMEKKWETMKRIVAKYQ